MNTTPDLNVTLTFYTTAAVSIEAFKKSLPVAWTTAKEITALLTQCQIASKMKRNEFIEIWAYCKHTFPLQVTLELLKHKTKASISIEVWKED